MTIGFRRTDTANNIMFFFLCECRECTVCDSVAVWLARRMFIPFHGSTWEYIHVGHVQTVHAFSEQAFHLWLSSGCNWSLMGLTHWVVTE